MKAISIRQPWASMIADGHKTIEIRTWTTRYRGPLLIVASARRDPEHLDLPTGCALCVVQLADVRPLVTADLPAAGMDPEEWEVGPDGWAWVLTDPRPVERRPIKGRLGLYDVPGYS